MTRLAANWPQPWPVSLDPKNFDPHRVEQMIGLANLLLHLLVPISLNPKRTGGWLMLAAPSMSGRQVPSCGRPMIRLQVPIGYIADGRSDTYRAIAWEKIRRLNRMALLRGHLSSWQSRAEGSGRYGGAILGSRSLYSFSGLEELDDEALVLVQAQWLSHLTSDQAEQIAEISHNPTYPRLRTAFAALVTT